MNVKVVAETLYILQVTIDELNISPNERQSIYDCLMEDKQRYLNYGDEILKSNRSQFFQSLESVK